MASDPDMSEYLRRIRAQGPPRVFPPVLMEAEPEVGPWSVEAPWPEPFTEPKPKISEHERMAWLIGGRAYLIALALGALIGWWRVWI